jgi:hypothetical protein
MVPPITVTGLRTSMKSTQTSELLLIWLHCLQPFMQEAWCVLISPCNEYSTDSSKYLMVDVVTNHMAYDGCGTCVDYSIFVPFNEVSHPEFIMVPN